MVAVPQRGVKAQHLPPLRIEPLDSPLPFELQVRARQRAAKNFDRERQYAVFRGAAQRFVADLAPGEMKKGPASTKLIPRIRADRNFCILARLRLESGSIVSVWELNDRFSVEFKLQSGTTMYYMKGYNKKGLIV